MKTFIISLPLVCCCFLLHAQSDKKTLTPEQTKELMSQLKMDTVKFLREAARQSCLCIDSVPLSHQSHKQVTAGIVACIDKQVTSYQLSAKLYRSLTSGGANNNITLNENKESPEYKRYYYDIERWLNDSCKSFRTAAATNNEESDFSSSSNPDAVDAYNAGLEKMQADNLKEALPFFEKAVQLDEKFAFAWDNLGICNRKLGNYEAALKAYNKSLEIDPKGKTPLQNIPVVYIYQKDYDKAIQAYERIATVYPDDPEIFYGIGNIYAYSKPDMEKALHNLCKAYNLYVKAQSPYRADAEKLISYVYGQMKKAGKEDDFYKILKEYNLNPSKN